MKSLQLKNDLDFQSLLKSLFDELWDARGHFIILSGLQEQAASAAKLMNYSKVFWHFTFEAHFDSTLIHLSKIYDQNPKGFHLKKFLEEGVNNNRWIFKPELFLKRLQANPNAEELLKAIGTIDEDKFIADLAFVSEKTNELVKKLVIWRSNFLAHRSLNFVLPSSSVMPDQPSSADMQILISRGFDILNRYAGYFEATSYSQNIFESDDFKFVLEALEHHPRHKEFQKWDEFYKKKP